MCTWCHDDDTGDPSFGRKRSLLRRPDDHRAVAEPLGFTVGFTDEHRVRLPFERFVVERIAAELGRDGRRPTGVGAGELPVRSRDG
jgi:hypothetical protein